MLDIIAFLVCMFICALLLYRWRKEGNIVFFSQIRGYIRLNKSVIVGSKIDYDDEESDFDHLDELEMQVVQEEEDEEFNPRNLMVGIGSSEEVLDAIKSRYLEVGIFSIQEEDDDGFYTDWTLLYRDDPELLYYLKKCLPTAEEIEQPFAEDIWGLSLKGYGANSYYRILHAVTDRSFVELFKDDDPPDYMEEQEEEDE